MRGFRLEGMGPSRLGTSTLAVYLAASAVRGRVRRSERNEGAVNAETLAERVRRGRPAPVRVWQRCSSSSSGLCASRGYRAEVGPPERTWAREDRSLASSRVLAGMGTGWSGSAFLALHGTYSSAVDDDDSALLLLFFVADPPFPRRQAGNGKRVTLARPGATRVSRRRVHLRPGRSFDVGHCRRRGRRRRSAPSGAFRLFRAALLARGSRPASVLDAQARTLSQPASDEPADPFHADPSRSLCLVPPDPSFEQRRSSSVAATRRGHRQCLFPFRAALAPVVDAKTTLFP